MDRTRSLLGWYRKSARSFPWRIDKPDPYVVLVSETMLQQTQTSRVAEALPQFIERFPTIQALAEASNGDVIRQWKGLGYNSRALRLRDAAKTVATEHDGILPRSLALLQSLPGVGPYTSAAILCFAFNKNVVVLDVNVRRVYSRLMKRQTTTADVEADNTLIPFAESIIPARSASEWHHAVMDLGSTICTARSPACTRCPLAQMCPSHAVLVDVVRTKKREPEFRGDPRRLWRGRFIEVLRQCSPGTELQHSVLFRRAAGSPLHVDEQEWYTATLTQLQIDGFIQLTPKGVRLAD
ncbi:MAG: A/G-specific adenine glycosylase [Candidatus Kapabacteria bacterium]|nr:A/G-specific adenine glycosylase [Candidatus Kapabacteria bacterium]